MQTSLLPVVLVCASLVSMLVGVRGLIEGRRVSQQEGPNTLMHYPAPLPWLKRRVTAARWVVWMGHLYFSTGLVGLLGAWLFWTAPEQTNHTQVCTRLADRLTTVYAGELQGGDVETKATLDGCMTTMHDHKGVRWLAVHSKRPVHGAGSDFNAEKHLLERAAYKVTAVEGLGARAAFAESRNGAGLNPILFFTNGWGHHRIEMNALQISPARQNATIEALKRLPTAITK